MITKKGITLTELMVAVAVMSVGIIGAVGAFKYLNQGIHIAKGKSLANNLAQEKIELLKNKSYYRVLVTTATKEDTNFSPSFSYDTGPNGTESMNVGGINFERRVYIRKVSEDINGNLTYLSWNSSDTGLKKILVYVVWQEGSTWKKVELRNLLENPNRANLSATFTGKVTSGGSPLQGAIVRAQENFSRFSETDASGNYSFTVEPGSYTLQAHKTGYFPAVSAQYSVTNEVINVPNLNLIVMASGTVTGTAWKRDHLVISQVVGSTESASWNQEYVEIYNPTTWTWTVNGQIGLKYQRAVMDDPSKRTIQITYITDSIPTAGFYLFTNTGTVTAGGVIRTADAVWSDSNLVSDFPDFANQKNIIRVADEGGGEGAGALELYKITDGSTIDVLGWDKNDAAKSAPFYETDAYDQNIGHQTKEQYVRFASPSGINSSYGPAYDTNNNNANFGEYNPVSIAPSNSLITKPVISGTPAQGAVVFADDGLSSPVTANSIGSFNLINIATGTWTVYVSSGIIMSTRSVTGTSSGFSVGIGDILLSSANAYGYIMGNVKNVNSVPLQNILMYAGGRQAQTNSSGNYTLPVSSGVYNVTANYQMATPSYVEFSSMGVLVSLGEVTKNVDFVLQQGGKIRGWVTTNGTDPLPDIVVSAFKGGVEQGNSITESDGYFLIWGAGISTGTYNVVPQLEAGEASVPSTYTVIVSPGETIFAGTFTVTGAMGYISGKVTLGSVTGPPITTGVLIYATTSTITSDPPTIDPTLRSGSNVYYAVSSNAEGKYSLPVRGGYTYNIYAWYTRWGGDTPAITRRDYTGVAVSAGQTVSDKNFFW